VKNVLIVNPAAGKKDAYLDTYQKFTSVFEQSGVPCQCYLTEKKRHATHIAKQLAECGEPVRIFALGGDGTLCEVLNGALYADNLEIGMVPTGSGNDFIKCFGDKEKFLDPKKQLGGVSQYTDIIKTEQIAAFNVVSVGLDAEIGKKMNDFRRFPMISGKMAYNLAVLQKLLGKLGKNIEIVVDGVKRVSGNFIFALAANGRCYGGGYHCAPQAVTDDGLLEFVAIKTPKWYKIPELLKLYKAGSFYGSDKFKGLLYYFRGKKMEIISSEDLSTNYDGEILTNKHETFEILPKAVRFIVPASE